MLVSFSKGAAPVLPGAFGFLAYSFWNRGWHRPPAFTVSMAALMMGADGVQMGSRFILTDECPTHPKAKEAIIKATDTDSAVTGFSRNNAVRCLKNEFTKEYLEKECSGAPQQELNDFATGTNRLGAVEGDIVHGAVLVGQSLNVLNDILPCAEVMERLIAEARDTLANAKNIVL